MKRRSFLAAGGTLGAAVLAWAPASAAHASPPGDSYYQTADPTRSDAFTSFTGSRWTKLSPWYQNFDPSLVSIDNGDLVLGAAYSGASRTWRLSGVMMNASLAIDYGYFEADLTTPSGLGICGAFWSLADDGSKWEVDFVETNQVIGGSLNRIDLNLHGPRGDTIDGQVSWDAATSDSVLGCLPSYAYLSESSTASTRHTYGCEVGSQTVRWYRDGAFQTSRPSYGSYGGGSQHWGTPKQVLFTVERRFDPAEVQQHPDQDYSTQMRVHSFGTWVH